MALSQNTKLRIKTSYERILRLDGNLLAFISQQNSASEFMRLRKFSKLVYQFRTSLVKAVHKMTCKHNQDAPHHTKKKTMGKKTCGWKSPTKLAQENDSTHFKHPSRASPCWGHRNVFQVTFAIFSTCWCAFMRGCAPLPYTE